MSGRIVDGVEDFSYLKNCHTSNRTLGFGDVNYSEVRFCRSTPICLGFPHVLSVENHYHREMCSNKPQDRVDWRCPARTREVTTTDVVVYAI